MKTEKEIKDRILILKDLEIMHWAYDEDQKLKPVVKINELRAEAIKWLKHDDMNHYLSPDLGRWIKDFFDIEDEDLK